MMSDNKSHPFIWQRKHKTSESVSEGINHLLKTLLLSFGVLGAFFITILLTFHLELSLVLRNILYGDPIIIKKPVSIIKNVPVFYKDTLTSSPISVDMETKDEKQINLEPSQDPPAPSTENITQIGTFTYQVRIGSDDRMATPQEIAEELNHYRKSHGKSDLIWDSVLAEYANNRAKYFFDNQILDEHEGFRKFVNNDGGFEKLGFDSLGENSAYLSGGELMAKSIIEQLFASDIYHDNNQLDPKWTHVGVGIEGLAINLIFGGNKTK